MTRAEYKKIKSDDLKGRKGVMLCQIRNGAGKTIAPDTVVEITGKTKAMGGGSGLGVRYGSVSITLVNPEYVKLLPA